MATVDCVGVPGGTVSTVLAGTAVFVSTFAPTIHSTVGSGPAPEVTTTEAPGAPSTGQIWPRSTGSGSAGAGGGTTATRETVTKVSTTLAPGESQQTTIQLAPSYRLLKITSNAPARVRLYSTTAKQASDVPRALGQAPALDHGLIFEFIATSRILSADLTPAVDGYDGRTTPTGVIPLTITNTDPNPATTITVQLTWIRTE